MDSIISRRTVGEKRCFGSDGCHKYSHFTIYVHIKYLDKSQRGIQHWGDYVYYYTCFSVDNIYSVLSTERTKTVGNGNHVFIHNSVHIINKYYIIKNNWRTYD